MAYRVEIRRQARKELARIEAEARQRIAQAIDALGDDPRPPGCKKLQGSPYWRIRVGVYRVIYQVEEGRLLVLVLEVGHRKEVYRKR